MSYYLMAAEFWTAVALGMGILPVVVASVGKAARGFPPGSKHEGTHAPHAPRATTGCWL